MTDDQGTTGLVVPPHIEQAFLELVTLIKGSESMNDTERQYWVDLLPVMKPEQLKELQTILENEKKQLNEIDEKYRKKAEEIHANTTPIQEIEQHRKARAAERKENEQGSREEDHERAENILDELSNL